MILDVTGIELTPGNGGKDCLGNGKHCDNSGKLIDICCDECNYLICCTECDTNCRACTDFDCPRNTR